MIIDLATVYRNKQIESIHYGIAVLVKGDRLIKTWGDPEFKCFTRSIIKPIQAKISLSFIKQELSNEHIAIACASHTSSAEQLRVISDFSEKYSIEEASLALGLLKGSSRDSGFLDSKFKHNCAGKHSLMKLAEKDMRILGYSEKSHPIQLGVEDEIKRLLGIDKTTEIYTAVDGCGLPTFQLSLKDMARLFSNTVTEKEYQKIYRAMNEYPLLIGGAKQVDSLIMQARPNNFIAKGGAEGLMAVLNLETEECLIIKIIDGSSRAKGIISSGFLEDLGWLNPGEISLDSDILNSQELVVGSIRRSPC